MKKTSIIKINDIRNNTSDLTITDIIYLEINSYNQIKCIGIANMF